MFDNRTIIGGVNDSKKISEKSRYRLFDEIISKSLSYGIGIVDQKKIDKINILQATMEAMLQAVGNLSIMTDLILIDGNRSFETNKKTLSVIKGDSASFSIAAASIIAKVTRDRIMCQASQQFPEYHWEKNKGYGTRQHIEAIKIHGITSLHRKSFLGKILDQRSLFLEL